MTRTNIDLDDDLLAETMRITGQKTKKGAVEEAMRRLTRAQIMRDLIEKTRGIGWDAPDWQEREFAEHETAFFPDRKP